MSSFTGVSGGVVSMPYLLDNNGENFPGWRFTLLTILDSLQLSRYLDCPWPDPSKTKPQPLASDADASLMQLYQISLQEWYKVNGSYFADIGKVRLIITSGLPPHLRNTFNSPVYGNDIYAAWSALEKRFFAITPFAASMLMKEMWKTDCKAVGDLLGHLDKMDSMRARLLTYGRDLTDREYGDMLFASLETEVFREWKGPFATQSNYLYLAPALDTSIRSYYSDIISPSIFTNNNTTSTIVKTEPTVTSLVATADADRQRGRRDNRPRRNVTCTNPNCGSPKGHTKEECWAMGGGREGKGPVNFRYGYGTPIFPGKPTNNDSSSAETSSTPNSLQATIGTTLVAVDNSASGVKKDAFFHAAS